MLLRVLGSAAGGGFPQWNCNCANCAGLRAGTLKASARTQSSVALSLDGERWLLVNASPDIHAQIRATPALQPRRGVRDSGIAAVLLSDGQIDHSTGLLLLREGRRLPVYATELVRDDLTRGFPLFRVLEHFCGVDWHPVPLSGSFSVAGLAGMELTAVALESKPAPYSPRREAPQPGDNIGLVVRDVATGKSLFYAPGLAAIDDSLALLMRRADCLLVDGTFWTDGEMIALGISKKRARDIGHLPQSGPGGMIESLGRFPDARKVLIHINNTNPILNEDSPERATLAAAGIEVAFDGMEIRL